MHKHVYVLVIELRGLQSGKYFTTFLYFATYREAVAQRSSVKKVFLEISQNWQENTCARVSFLIKLQVSGSEIDSRFHHEIVAILVLSTVSSVPTIIHKIFETNSFSCEIAPYGKSSISIFQKFLATIEKIFTLQGRLGTRL